jgi:prepilin-type processing-associated H-X9-DG protein
MKKNNFTMLELVLCVSAVVLLTIFCVTAAGSNAVSAKTTACLNNLNVWSKGLTLYAEANDGYGIPQRIAVEGGKFDIWCGYKSPLRNMLAPGVSDRAWRSGGTITGCPENVNNWAKRKYSYGHNTSLLGDNSNAVKISQFQFPQTKVAFADATMYNFQVGSYEAETSARLAVRHEGGNATNMLFLDGHTKTWAGKEVASRNAPRQIRAMFRR